MSRFTRRDATGIWVKEPDDYATYYPYYDGSYEAIEKLAHYEDLEEQGRLIEQKHGRWMLESKTENCNGGHTHYCDRCHDYYTTEADSLYFCPRCGAKMIGVEQPGRNGWKLDFVDGEWKKVWGVINERFMKTRTEEDFPNCGAKMMKGTEE